MTDAFVKAAKDKLPAIDFKTDYAKQLPLLLVFLKSNPEYLETVLPVLYKVGNKQEPVRDFLDDVHAQAPQVLEQMFPVLFKSEKALAMQIPLLMDMGRYLDADVFASLDFKLLLKATPEKLLKAFTPTPATWDAFMDLANGLVKNDATKELAQMVACSVGLQVSMAKPKDQKSSGVDRYDWVDAAALWKEHDWQWSVGETIQTIQLRAKGESLVADMLYSVAMLEDVYPGKAKEALDWVNAQPQPSNPIEGNGVDAAVQYVYAQTEQDDVKAACLERFNARAQHCSILQYAWRTMPPEHLVLATKKLVDDVLVPMGATKASLLAHQRQKDGVLPGMLDHCSTRLYTILNHSALPLGDMDAAMHKVLHEWCNEFPKHDPSKGGHDYRQYALKEMLDTIAHDVQEPARCALQESNAFKQLMLYAAYLKETNPDWSKYSSMFMPDLTEKPLSMLSSIYPEHQDTWAKLQQKVLEGNFKHTDTMQIVAKVLFNQDLTMRDIQSTCAALDCKPEMFFCSLQSPSTQAFIPDSFDFSEVSPS